MTTEELKTNCPECGALIEGFDYEEEKDWACRAYLGECGIEYEQYRHDTLTQKFMCEDCGYVITEDDSTALAILIRNAVREEEKHEQEGQGQG